MKKFTAAFYIFSLIILSTNCSRQPQQLRGVITFTYGYFKINDKYAGVGDRVFTNDILETDTNSFAVVQISQTAVITLHSKTKLKLNKLVIDKDKSQIIELYLEKGNIFNKLIKKGTGYSVKSITSTASARGTSYEVISDGNKNKINLLSGKLYIKKIENAANINLTPGINKPNSTGEIELQSGQAVVIDANEIFQSVTLEKTEIDVLSDYNSFNVIEDVENTIPQLNTIPVMIKQDVLNKEKYQNFSLIKDENTVQSLIKKKKRTIEEIKGVFGRTDEIILYSGKVIKGAIIERGEKYSILTPERVIKISAKDIQSVRVVR